MAYYLNNGNKYSVKFERNSIYVTEEKPMFDGSFYSVVEVIRLDSMAEVREYLKEKNGGIDVY